MSVSFTGPWDKVLSRLGAARNWIMGNVDPPLWAFGWQLQAEMKKRLLASPPPPLLPQTIARKRRKRAMGLARFIHKTWRERGYLVKNGFKQPEVRSDTIYSKLVLVLVSDQEHVGGLPMSELFSYLEFGTRYIKPRPILSPILDEMEAGTLPALSEFRDKFVVNIQKSWE
jgi:hypothetical protein